jgi:exonuclease III
MSKNSKIDSDNCAPNLNATNLKPLNLKGFTIANLNIRSLARNIDQFRLYLQKQQFDVICINETRLDATVSSHEVGINGYEIVRKDRNRNGGGEGVLFT